MKQQATQINSDSPNNTVINKQGMLSSKSVKTVKMSKGNLAPF